MTTARQVLDRCAELDRFTATPPKLERVYLSREHASANAVAGRWIEEAGLRSWQDAAGNVCGRREGREPGLPALLVGSHLDTVPDAGSYDGMLGVVMAIAVAERLGERIDTLPFALEVIGFSDEEGTRFGTALLGSCAVAGTWDEQWWDLRDRDGVAVVDAMGAAGLEPDLGPSRLLADVGTFVELHVEQGRDLVDRDAAVGVASRIWPHGRYRFDFAGEANHAGTTRMEDRRDPMLTYAMTALAANKQARLGGQRATFGRVETVPNGTNAVS